MRWLRYGLLVTTLGITGCANTIMSNQDISDKTSMALGVPSDQVSISNRRYDGGVNTYYTAQVGRRQYACMINGGTVLSFGITNPPQCNPQ